MPVAIDGVIGFRRFGVPVLRVRSGVLKGRLSYDVARQSGNRPLITKAGNQAQIMALLCGPAIELIRKFSPKNF